MAPTTVRVRATADRETAARLLTERNLLAIPVVDDEDHLLGIITEDDVADVLEAEATEDIERLGGSQPLNVPYRLVERAAAGPQADRLAAAAVRRRGLHGHRPARLLRTSSRRSSRCSFFIPLLIGTGGNIGSQTVTLIVRAMALNEVSLRDVGWIVVQGDPGRADPGRGHGGRRVRPGGAARRRGGHRDWSSSVTILAICLWSATVAARRCR